LLWLVDAFNRYGIRDERITVFMALGTHKSPDEKILPRVLGPVVDRVKVVHHNINGPMLDCGVTSKGTPVLVDARIREAGLLVLYSGVTHHYFAGFTGGRKLITPGISSFETIQSNHSLTWKNPKESDERHPMSASGILTGNPVSDDMLECARMAIGDTPSFSICSVLTPDKDFAFISTGELESAHSAACGFADKIFTVDIDKRADLIFASAGGYPKDLNLIQSHKGLDNAVKGLNPGGTIVYAMGCRDGSGHPIIDEFAFLSTDEIRDRLLKKYEIYGQTTYSIKQKTRDYRVIAVSLLDSELLSELGFIPASSIESAMELISDDLLSGQPVYHIPRADLTVLRSHEGTCKQSQTGTRKTALRCQPESSSSFRLHPMRRNT